MLPCSACWALRDNSRVNWAFDLSLLGLPLLAGLLVLATHVLLGREVLRRGIIFIDITIAQVAALGVLSESLFHFDDGHPGWHTQFGAILAALSAAALLAWTEKRWPDIQEALIGSLYVIAASLGFLMLANNPHGTEEMSQLLAGQILWVTPAKLWPVALLYAGLLAAWFAGARRNAAGFYILFAIAVTASVQLVGVYLVFASLILPALAVRSVAGTRGLLLGYGIGAAGYALGLWLSVPLDLPSGPLVVVTLAACALLSAPITASRNR